MKAIYEDKVQALINAIEKQYQSVVNEEYEAFQDRVEKRTGVLTKALGKLLRENKPLCYEMSEFDKLEWKIYSTQEMLIRYLANKHGLELYYLGQGVGEGYVSNGKQLRVFNKGSYADEDYMITTLYKEDYKNEF